LRDGDMSPEVIKSDMEVQEAIEQQNAQAQQQQLLMLAQQMQAQNTQTPTAA